MSLVALSNAAADAIIVILMLPLVGMGIGIAIGSIRQGKLATGATILVLCSALIVVSLVFGLTSVNLPKPGRYLETEVRSLEELLAVVLAIGCTASALLVALCGALMYRVGCLEKEMTALKLTLMQSDREPLPAMPPVGPSRPKSHSAGKLQPLNQPPKA